MPTPRHDARSAPMPRSSGGWRADERVKMRDVGLPGDEVRMYTTEKDEDTEKFVFL